MTANQLIFLVSQAQIAPGLRNEPWQRRLFRPRRWQEWEVGGMMHFLASLPSVHLCLAIGWWPQSIWICHEPSVSRYVMLKMEYKNLSDWEKSAACYERAIALIGCSDDKRTLGVLLVNLGNCLYPQGKWDEAYTEYERSLAIFVELGDPTGVIRALNGLGITCGYKEQWDQAEKYYRQSAENARELNDTLGWADASDNLGIALVRQGRFEEAEDCYRRSLQLYESMGHLAGSEHVLNNWGRLWEERGGFAKSIEHYQQCIRIDQQLGAKWDELDAQINLARALTKDGRVAEAKTILDYVISESQSCGFPNHQAWALKEQGDLFLVTSEVDMSLKTYNRALLMARSVNPQLPQQIISAIEKAATSMMQPPDELTAWLQDVRAKMEENANV